MADAAALADPGARGRLDVKDRAVASMVVAAALNSPDVDRHGGGLGRLAGRDLPRVRVDVAGDHVAADVDIAVRWGRPLASVAAATAQRIHAALGSHGGLTVDRVGVHVATVIAPAADDRVLL